MKFHQNPLLTPCPGPIFQEESIGTTPGPSKYVKNRFFFLISFFFVFN